MKKLFAGAMLLLVLLTSAFATADLALPLFSIPAFMYDGMGEEQIYKALNGDDALALLAIPMLSESDVGIADFVSGSSSDIASSLFSLLFSLMPLDSINCHAATGTITVTPAFTEGKVEAAITVDYDNVSIVYDDGTEPYVSVIDGSLTASISLSDDSLFTISLIPEDLSFDDEIFTESIVIAADFDSETADYYLANIGLNTEIARYITSELIAESMQDMSDEDLSLLESMTGVEAEDVFTADGVVNLFSSFDMLDLLDCISFFVFTMDSVDEMAMLSVIEPYVIIGGVRTEMDLFSMIGALELLGSL